MSDEDGLQKCANCHYLLRKAGNTEHEWSATHHCGPSAGDHAGSVHIPNASRRFCQPSDLSARRPALGRDPVQNPAGCLAQAPPATLRRATGPGWRAPPGPRGSGFIEGRHRAAEGCGGDRRSGRSRHSRRRYVAFGTRGASTGRVVCDLARLYVACAPGSHLLCRRRLAFYPRARFHRYRAAIRHLGRALAGSCARSQAVGPLIC